MTIDILPINAGQLRPLAGQLTPVALIDSNTNAYVNIYITNTDGTTPDKVRVALVPDGATLQERCYVCYDTQVLPDSFFVLPSIGLGPNDQVLVYSSLGVSTFHVNGSQLFN